MPPIEFAPSRLSMPPHPPVRVGEPMAAPHPVREIDGGQQISRGAGIETEAASRARTKTAEEERGVKGLESIRDILTAPFNMEFFGGMVAAVSGMLFANPLIKFSRGEAVAHAPVVVAEALRHTTIKDTFQLPANILRTFGAHVAGIGGTANERWAAPLERHAQSLDAWGKNMSARTALLAAKPASSVGRAMQKFEKTSAGQWMHEKLSAASVRRVTKLTEQHGKHLDAAGGVFTTEVLPWWKNPMRHLPFVKQTEPVTVEAGAHLAPLMQRMQATHGLSGEARVAHLEALSQDLKTLTLDKGLTGEAARRAKAAARAVGETLGSAKAMHFYETVANDGLGKKIAIAAGHVPLFSALMVAGTAFGLGAVALTTRHESAASKATYKQLVADLGGDMSNPYAVAVKQAYGKQKGGHALKSGFSLVGEGANGLMMMLPNGGNMAVMGGMLVPQMAGMLVQDNPLLNAYATRKAFEAGEIKLEPAQDLYNIKQLVAAVPSMAIHGGIYNNMATPLAEAMQQQKMTTAQIVSLLSDPPRFTKFAKDVHDKREAATEAAKADDTSAPKTASPSHAAVDDNGATKAEAAYHAVEKPASVKGGVEHHGRVVAAHHASAQAH